LDCNYIKRRGTSFAGPVVLRLVERKGQKN
jgi:hypothetical protein